MVKARIHDRVMFDSGNLIDIEDNIHLEYHSTNENEHKYKYVHHTEDRDDYLERDIDSLNNLFLEELKAVIKKNKRGKSVDELEAFIDSKINEWSISRELKNKLNAKAEEIIHKKSIFTPLKGFFGEVIPHGKTREQLENELNTLWNKIDSSVKESKRYLSSATEHKEQYIKRIELLEEAKSLCLRSFKTLSESRNNNAPNSEEDIFLLEAVSYYNLANKAYHEAEGGNFKLISGKDKGDKAKKYILFGSSKEKYKSYDDYHKTKSNVFTMSEEDQDRIEKIKDKRADWEKEIEMLEKDKKQYMEKYDTLTDDELNTLRKLNIDIKNKVGEIESLEGELKGLEKNIPTKNIIKDIEHRINVGHTAKSAVNLAKKRHESDNDPLSEDQIKRLNTFAKKHEKHREETGHPKWGNLGGLGVISLAKRIGRQHNANSIEKLMDELEKLEMEKQRLKRIVEDEEKRGVKNSLAAARLKRIEHDITDVEGRIAIFEEHPELLQRGKKHIGDGISKMHNSIKGAKDWAVNGAIGGYSKHKARIAGWISTVCAFLILVILLWMKVVGNSAYIPVSWAQIIVFMFFALLLEVIKSSMSEDKAGENEAREIIFILAVLALIITAAIKDPAVGFWTSLIFCAIISAYLLMDFYTDSALVTIVLAIVMMVIIYFTAAGWMDELGVQTEKLAVQTGFAEAIETSIGAVREGASDVWLMITNPNGWYAKKEMEQNAQKDPAASDRAVEITTAKITPSIVNLGDEINLLVEIENFGDRDTTKPARDVEISAKKTGDHQTDFALEDSEEEDVEVIRYVGDIVSHAGAQEVFEIKAPEGCIATFKLEAGVSYGYDVDTMGNIFIIGRKRYDELVKQDKFVQEKQVAKSSSGPVSVSIMTNLPQPIPVDNGTKFSIHFGIVNTRSSGGKVNVTGVDIAIPKDFVPALDKGAYKNCKLCKLPNSGDESFVHYSFKGLYDNELDTCSANPDKNLLIGGDIKIFKCEMEYNGTDDIPFKKPMDVHVSIDYIYKYTKTASFTVRKRDIDLEEDIIKCS